MPFPTPDIQPVTEVAIRTLPAEAPLSLHATSSSLFFLLQGLPLDETGELTDVLTSKQASDEVRKLWATLIGGMHYKWYTPFFISIKAALTAPGIAEDEKQRAVEHNLGEVLKKFPKTSQDATAMLLTHFVNEYTACLGNLE